MKDLLRGVVRVRLTFILVLSGISLVHGWYGGNVVFSLIRGKNLGQSGSASTDALLEVGAILWLLLVFLFVNSISFTPSRVCHNDCVSS